MYSLALERQYTAASIIDDSPVVFNIPGTKPYKPVNYDGRYRGAVRLRQALANSLNAASVGLLADVGLDRVHRLAGEMGLELDPDPWTYGLSLTLGGAEVRLLDATAAYATLAAGGLHAEPTGILNVTRVRDGKTLYRLDPSPRAVLSPQTAYQLSDILSDDEARSGAFGTGSALDTSRPAAVKTGTTDDFRDNLTIGYTPFLAVGVWAGNKDGRPMRDVLGITGAAPIWHDAMEAIYESESLLVDLGDGDLPSFTFAEPT